MKFYIASSFKNIDSVMYVSERLKKEGFVHAYDWTQNNKATSIEELKEIGQNEKRAVMEADFVIVLFPAGKSSHVELGIALGQGKNVFLYSPDEKINDLETTSTFYHLPGVNKCYGTIEEFIEKISAVQLV
ncbi:MAG TPA: nucleoside 2-deoxyribosyltransferase [Bacillales bacterium]|nr:nucleoside 2-deoxyribosyltransferase [Bacillales bacterium]